MLNIWNNIAVDTTEPNEQYCKLRYLMGARYYNAAEISI